MTTFYSVNHSIWGRDSVQTAWFDSKEEAFEFANHDYRDEPVRHGYRNASKIEEAKELVAMTRFELSLQ